MDLLTIRNNIKQSLEDDNVYRTDIFLDNAINDGYKLLAVLSLFDERRGSVDVTGGRNFVCLPTASDGAHCIAPFYIANASTGSRVNPIQIDDFEFYHNRWESRTSALVEGDDALWDEEEDLWEECEDQWGSTGETMYYSLFSPHHYSFSAIIICPIQNVTRTKLNVIGAYVPITLTSSAEPRLAEGYQSALFHYGRFVAFVAEPGRAKDALSSYQEFVKVINNLVADQKSRFPSGRDYEPLPVEFTYDIITQQQQKEETKADER